MILTNTMDYSQSISGFADKLSFGGMMVLVGVAAVFSVLTIIWLSLTIFSSVFKNISERKQKKAVESTPIPEPVAVDTTADEEIVAVIAAAIAMAESESDGIKFKVVSFRRV
jgi:sodium pump decarboxylase gamma subunit